MEFNLYKEISDLNDNYSGYYKLFSSNDTREPWNRESWNKNTVFLEMEELELFSDILSQVKKFDEYDYIEYTIDEVTIILEKLSYRYKEIEKGNYSFINKSEIEFYKIMFKCISENKEKVIKFFDDLISWIHKHKKEGIKYLGL